MKKFNPLMLVLGLLGVSTLISTAGAVGGTLAWYAYVTRTTLSYSGTSVNSTAQLQIGIASDIAITDMPNTVEHVQFTGDANHYYFAKSGAGLSSSIITKYLSAKDYATNALQAVTSGKFERGDSFGLKKAPNEFVHDHSVDAVDAQYVFLPLVFRVASDATSPASYLKDQEIWLSKATAKKSTAEDGEIYKGLRVYFDRDNSKYTNDFIFNPNPDVSTDGETVVGGVLDLSGDEYFDFESGKEIIYGEYESIGGLSADGYVVPQSGEVYQDLNGTGVTDRRTTFTAKHYHGIKYYENLNSCVFEKADYKCLDTIKPTRDNQTGLLTNQSGSDPTSLVKTGDANEHYLGRVDVTIYLEGWDHSVIDNELSHKFDLGLTFEINRVD